jgi:uncharacterized protein (TIGR02444 family)
MSPTRDENPFWQFSLAVYGAPGVAQECIALQDRHGIDVNVLLFVAWLSAELGFVLSPATLESIDASVSVWRQNVVAPVRTARRHLKQSGPPALYDEIKALELKLEQAEQLQLFDLTHTLDAPHTEPVQALRANLALYAERKKAPVPTCLLATVTARLAQAK